ncbi:MAG: sarcosine oxidase subunit gamma [Candidatus Puniceispirillaceae bacterium]
MASQTKAVPQGNSAFFGIEAEKQPQPETGAVGLVISEMKHQGKLNIRCRPAFHKTLSKIVGLDTAPANNHVSRTDSRQAVWLGPDEIMLMVEAGSEGALAKQIEDQQGKQTISVNDVSDALTSLHLKGPAIRDVLAKGCALDLHPDHFKAGQCAQTMLSHAAVTLVALADDEMLVICRTSFTEYTVAYLCDAALEYGYQLKA